ncbi:MAG TPA: M48 family metalloprotease [Planctomycetota bacterium]|nr:M48 family metalloprotease [Planctomycetota bacterium]
MMNRLLVPVLAGALAAVVGCSHPKLTESQEYYVGRGVAANAMFDAEGRYVGLYDKDQNLEEYVALVGLSVALESDRPETFKGYHFGVVNSTDINAFAAPGGFIFVTTGALKLMENEDELAGVLSHEIGHVNLRHPEDHANRAADQAGVMGILDTGGHLASTALSILGRKSTADNLATLTKGFGSVLDGFTKELIVNGYGRESELAADALGVKVLCRPGVRYNPGALKEFIARLPKKERGAWSTHPELDGRMQAIDDEIKKQGPVAETDPARTARFKAATAGLRGS